MHNEYFPRAAYELIHRIHLAQQEPTLFQVRRPSELVTLPMLFSLGNVPLGLPRSKPWLSGVGLSVQEAVLSTSTGSLQRTRGAFDLNQ